MLVLNIFLNKGVLINIRFNCRNEKVGSSVDITMLCPGPTFSNLLQVVYQDDYYYKDMQNAYLVSSVQNPVLKKYGFVFLSENDFFLFDKYKI